NLSQQLAQSASVSVVDYSDVVYIARHETTAIMRINITVVTRFPAYATSMGRVLLAGLPENALQEYFAEANLTGVTGYTLTDETDLRKALERIRAAGYAIVTEELEVSLPSAAP